ncbi:MAG TPA: YiiX/YebB-like N1pC/P60 family cysteine hydrolase [Patescibacteria group bacterium]|nr:YiiX/YebB-like N1pC/P60 family cysteine hydrolase [Patescibacteria group bacterium]
MTLSTIFYKIKNTLIAWFSDIRVYAGGFVLFGNSSYSIKGPDTRYVLNVLEPGDVLLRRYDHYLGSILIPGYWSHAALYVGDGYVIHMLGQGINKEDILTFLRCDDICILRCPDNNKAVTAIKNAFNCLYKDIGYDYEFNFNDEKEMSCTEFIDTCYEHPKYSSKPIDKLILPDDLLESIFEVVWKKD